MVPLRSCVVRLSPLCLQDSRQQLILGYRMCVCVGGMLISIHNTLTHITTHTHIHTLW